MRGEGERKVRGARRSARLFMNTSAGARALRVLLRQAGPEELGSEQGTITVVNGADRRRARPVLNVPAERGREVGEFSRERSPEVHGQHCEPLCVVGGVHVAYVRIVAGL